MKWFKRILVLALLLITGVLVHYYLPQRDIVKVVGTEVKRMDISKGSPFWDSPDVGTNDEATRDVRFISTVRENGKTRVYRNEDTGWSFPFYLKFDSSDLDAKAKEMTDKEGQFVAVTHYGWRIKLFSIWPNATKIKPVSGPDALLIPWFNIVFLCILAFIFINIWLALRRFKKKRIDPISEKIEDVAEDAGEEIAKGGNAVGKFFRRWFGTTKDTSTKNIPGKDKPVKNITDKATPKKK